MGKITVQMKDPKLAEVLASTRAGDEVELKDGDAVVGSFVRRFGSQDVETDAGASITTVAALRASLTQDTPESAFDPLPEEDLRKWEGRL